jgi:hypothetical protein
MSSSWPSRRATVSAQVWNLAPGLFRHPVTAVDQLDDPDSLSYNKSCLGVLHDRSEDSRGRRHHRRCARPHRPRNGPGRGERRPLPPSPQEHRGHKTNPTATDMDTTETGTAGTGAGGAGTAGPGGTRGSTRASAPPVRSATSPAACASSRGSCRRNSVAAPPLGW